MKLGSSELGPAHPTVVDVAQFVCYLSTIRVRAMVATVQLEYIYKTLFVGKCNQSDF